MNEKLCKYSSASNDLKVWVLYTHVIHMQLYTYTSTYAYRIITTQ